MWAKIAGPLLALLLLTIETPVLFRTALWQQQREVRLPRPFAIKIFEPVITTSLPRGENLFWSDRVLEIDGRPIRNKADFEQAMTEAEVRGRANVLVEHYPENDEPWQETAVADFRSRRDPDLWNSLATTAWFSSVIWPGVCILLAAAVLAVNGSTRRAQLAALVLTAAGHFSWVIITPYAWPEPLRTLMLLYDAVIAAIGPLALFAAAIAWPVAPPNPGWDRWLWRIAFAWSAIYVAVRWAEKTSYALLAPFAALDAIFGSAVFVLVVIAGVTTAIRWSGSRAQGLTASQRSIATVLRRGVWSFQLSLGFVLIFLPWFMESAVFQLDAVVWVCYAACLGFPLALAWVGTRSDAAPVQLPQLPQSQDWNSLFANASHTAQQAMGLQLLALYGPVEGELRVQAAVPGAAQWPPLHQDATPAAGILHWEPFPAGYLAVAPADFDEWQREGLRQLALQVAEQAEAIAAPTPDAAA